MDGDDVDGEDDEYAEPDELIAWLEPLWRAPTADTDVPGVRGALGVAWLEICVRDQDESALVAGLAHLHAAVAAGPDHPDRFDWFYHLAVGHRMSAEAGDRPAERDQAIAWFERLVADFPIGRDGRDSVVVELAFTYANRYLDRRYGPGANPVDPAAPEAFVADADRLRGLVQESQFRAALDAVAGLARLERYDQSARLDDLEVGISLLAENVWSVPRGDAPIEHAIGQLPFAYWDRAERTGWDRPSLLAAVAAAERAIESAEDDGGRDIAELAIAFARYALWQRSRDLADLAAAVECWHRRPVDGEDGEVAGLVMAELLTARADHTGDVSAVDGALALLTGLLTADSLALDVATQFARSARVRHALAADHPLLERALSYLDPIRPADDDGRIERHIQLLVTADHAARHDSALSPASGAGSVRRLTELVEEGYRLLAGATSADGSLRARLAGTVADSDLWATGTRWGRLDVDRIEAAIEVAASWVDAPPELAVELALLSDVVGFARAAGGETSRLNIDLTRAVQKVREASTAAERASATGLLGLLAAARATATGSVTDRAEADELLRSTCDTDLVLLARMNRAMAAGQRGVFDEAAWSELWKAVESAPRTDLVVRSIRPMVAAVMRAMGHPDRPVDDAAPAEPDDDPQRQLLVEWSVLFGRLGEIEGRGDPADLRALAARAETVSRTVTPEQRLARHAMAWLQGRIWLVLARHDRSDEAAAAAAVRHFADAGTQLDGEEHRLWAIMAMNEAEARRLSKLDEPRSLSLGLAVLAAHARTVMLQTDTRSALDVATLGADDADTVTDWALADGDLAAVVAALEASRGLVLEAAAASRAVPARLVAAGRPDLAQEWAVTAGLGRDELNGQPLGGTASSRPEPSPPGMVRVSDALRAKAVTALVATGDGGAPVTVGRIQSALTATGAGALVYLRPPRGQRRGIAVVVPAVGQVGVVDLPDLAPDDRGMRGDQNHPRSRDLGPVGPGLTDQLSHVGEWAGENVLPVLQAALDPTLPAHLVLVPMGELTLVPWHAAYVVQDGRRRYAVEDLAFSYSPSARMFCAAAERPMVAVDSALIVGNPDGSLAFAGLESRAIHETFYPHGRYLGEGASSPGTAEAVLDWTARARGSSLLHFACHGLADPARPDHAGLHLSGGVLSAGDLIEATRLAGLAVDQVFLAACHTNAIGDTYDEAFSLASVFLAGGAPTVYGSLWAVPDEATSLLMFMVHHYLRIEHRSPAQALHAAQLWMLDENRRPPASMPHHLAGYAVRPELADPLAWAAFTHLGR